MNEFLFIFTLVLFSYINVCHCLTPTISINYNYGTSSYSNSGNGGYTLTTSGQFQPSYQTITDPLGIFPNAFSSTTNPSNEVSLSTNIYLGGFVVPTAFTFSTWFQATGNPGIFSNIFSTSGAGVQSFAFYQNQFYIWTDQENSFYGGGFYLPPTSINYNQWYYVTLTYAGNIFTLYLNGVSTGAYNVLDNGDGTPFATGPGNKLYLGMSVIGSGPDAGSQGAGNYVQPAYYYQTMFFNSSLTGAQVASLYTIAPTASPSTPIPTTLIPTTLIPSTVVPTTLIPSTVVPTTLIPSTVVPTTLIPSTVVATTHVPTTLTPSTIVPTTLTPSTVVPTTLTPSTVVPTTLTPSTVVPTTLTPSTVVPTTLTPSTVVPTTHIPTTSTPTTSITSTVAPTTSSASTVVPTTLIATTVIATTVGASTSIPTTVTPTTHTPTSQPSTSIPTTVSATTHAPSTNVNVTTSQPTTIPPSTIIPSTVIPSTTHIPTTVTPTTSPIIYFSTTSPTQSLQVTFQFNVLSTSSFVQSITTGNKTILESASNYITNSLATSLTVNATRFTNVNINWLNETINEQVSSKQLHLLNKHFKIQTTLIPFQVFLVSFIILPAMNISDFQSSPTYLVNIIETQSQSSASVLYTLLASNGFLVNTSFTLLVSIVPTPTVIVSSTTSQDFWTQVSNVEWYVPFIFVVIVLIIALIVFEHGEKCKCKPTKSNGNAKVYSGLHKIID